jgi:hypothetical protein
VDPFAPLSRFWRTADGWLRLHANYPWHKERALRVLGCQDRPEAVGLHVLDLTRVIAGPLPPGPARGRRTARA